jgi:hypothetical protein
MAMEMMMTMNVVAMALVAAAELQGWWWRCAFCGRRCVLAALSFSNDLVAFTINIMFDGAEPPTPHMAVATLEL